MNSILRREQLEYLKSLQLSGEVIDLGAKSQDNSYHALLSKGNVINFTFSDFYREGPNIIKIDFEEKFENVTKQYDEILVFNVLEHIYNYQQFLRECYKICKPNGRIHILVPFLWKYHMDPHDFHRYTHEALAKSLRDVGWQVDVVEPTVSGRFAVTCSLWEGYFPNFARRAFQSLLLASDRILSRHSASNGIDFPLGYTVLARKA